MIIIREFDGRLWKHWSNHPGEKKANLFQTIAAKYGVEVLINKECYDVLGRRYDGPMAYWLKPEEQMDFSDIWDEFRIELQAHNFLKE